MSRQRFLFVSVLIASMCAAPAFAGPFKRTPQKLDDRIRRSAERFQAMQADPQKRIPAELLARAKGIIILNKFKAGFLVGGEAGGGVAMVRDRNTGAWGAPAFVATASGSWGLQIGAQESDVILLLMEESALRPLRGGSINVGVDVTATVGPVEEGGDYDTTTLQHPVLVYSSAGGLFAGAAFKGGGIMDARRSNQTYYGRSMEGVLFGEYLRPTATGAHLATVIEGHAARRGR